MFDSISSYFTTIIEPFTKTKNNDSFSYVNHLFEEDNILIGFTRNSKKEGLRFSKEATGRIYLLEYFKKMDDGLLYIFEDEIRLRLYIRESSKENIYDNNNNNNNKTKYLQYHIFSVNHNLNKTNNITEKDINYYYERVHNDNRAINNLINEIIILVLDIYNYNLSAKDYK